MRAHPIYDCPKCRIYFREYDLIDAYGDDTDRYDDCPECGSELEVSNDGSEPTGLPDWGWPIHYGEHA